MKAFSRFLVPDSLEVPFVPLRVELAAGLAILSELGSPIAEDDAREKSFRVKLTRSSVAMYHRDNHVYAVWYDDPAGRWTAAGRQRKIELHLERYGPLESWVVWNENNWMKYWKNTSTGVFMVYGVHKDVIRFNAHDA